MGNTHTVRFEPLGIEMEADEDETILAAAFRETCTLSISTSPENMAPYRASHQGRRRSRPIPDINLGALRAR